MSNPRLKARQRFNTVMIYCVLALWIAFSLFSFSWIILTSFKSNKDLYAGVWSLPQKIHIENYVKAWDVVNLKRYFVNSVLVTFASIFLLTFICTPAAYVLVRYRFRFSNVLNNIFIAGMGIPAQLMLIPLYKIILGIHLNDTLVGLGLVYISLSIPFTTYLLSGFLRSLPSELEDAAMVDGCNEFQTFWKVMFPLAQPGIITAAIFNFIFLWNEYLLALVFITSEQKRTISLGLYSIQSAMLFTADWVGLFAAVVIVMVPTALIYIFLSEKVMAGITLGAVKG